VVIVPSCAFGPWAWPTRVGGAQVGGGRGRPRRVRRVEQTQVREDLAHHGRVLHGGDEPPPAATARAGEDIESEHAAYQGGPKATPRCSRAS
jgi:hypothetical protein